MEGIMIMMIKRMANTTPKKAESTVSSTINLETCGNQYII